jgi:beta-glucan synthesis-associated protein KRE6
MFYIHGKLLTIVLCRGSAGQQAISSLTQLPVDMFEGSGQQFHTLVSQLACSSHFLYHIHSRPRCVIGFEYWTDPTNPTEGFVTWQSDRQQTTRLGATAVGQTKILQ